MSTETPIVTQGQDAVFPAAELGTRIAAARRVLAERDIDVYIVTGPENIFYLTGQQTPGTTPSRHCCCRSKATLGSWSESSSMPTCSPTAG